MTTTYHTPHSNPFALTAAAFNSIYSDLDAELVAQDARLDDLEAGAPSLYAGICQVRMSLTSGTPVTVADVSAAATLYINTFRGNQVGLYYSGAWLLKPWTTAGHSIAALTANTNYDVFLYWTGSAIAVETVAWTNATTRATALTTQDGVLVKNGAADRRYIGTIRINATGGQTEDTMTQRYVWNYYNRVRRPLRKLVATDSWAYTTGTWRQWNADTANKVEYVVGWEEEPIVAEAMASGTVSSANVNVGTGIGVDVTNANSCHFKGFQALLVGLNSTLRSLYEGFPGVGYHALNLVEYGGANVTFYGDQGFSNVVQNGLIGHVVG